MALVNIHQQEAQQFALGLGTVGRWNCAAR
jgi:hypothetical protein